LGIRVDDLHLDPEPLLGESGSKIDATNARLPREGQDTAARHNRTDLDRARRSARPPWHQAGCHAKATTQNGSPRQTLTNDIPHLIFLPRYMCL
jgi:hypothetical protein